MKHYICTGGCEGVAQQPGTCQAESCRRHHLPLIACSCTDGKHKGVRQMKPTLSPYLNFSGKTAEAMKFYQSVLGGELKMQTFGESGISTSDTDKDKIMHADLKNDALSFMASDGNAEHPVHMGDNIHMSIVGSDEETLTKYFNGLAQGGKIDMPLAKQFWGDTFGMLTDKFSIHWMVNISKAEQK